MMVFSAKQRPSLIIISMAVGFFLGALFFALPALAAECDGISRQLRGTNEVIQGQGGGGLWGLMQQTEGYQEKAMVGLQIDTKLQLSVTNYETICQNGESPGKDMADKIISFMDRAREIKNKAKRGSPDQIVPMLDSLNSDLGKFLENSG